MASISEIAALFDFMSIFLLLATIVVFLIPIFIIFPPIPVARSDALRQTHSKLGLPLPRSNLQTQHSPVHGPQPGQPARIQSLHIYPLKSCRGIELSKAKVLPNGLQFDRLYTFAHLKDRVVVGGGDGDESTRQGAWEFLTQRQLPLLANVKVDLWLPDPQKSSRQLGKLEDSFIIARFPWTEKGPWGLAQRVVAKLSRGLSAVPEKEFMLPVEFPSQDDISARGYEYADVKIWKDAPTALNMETELPPELALYLGVSNRLSLFRVDPMKHRQVFRCAPTKEELGYQPVVGFQDAYPLHMLSLSSLHAFESTIIKDQNLQHLDIRRFRANIIISGAAEYDEDGWKGVRFRSAKSKTVETVFDVCCRTVRCKLPNVDPATGIRHKAEPDRALRKFRDIDDGAPKLGCLGMQMCPMFAETDKAEDLESTLEVGMEIDVLQRGSHLYIK